MSDYPKDWGEVRLDNIANIFDNLRVPVSKDKRTVGNTPYYGANGIQDYVSGYTHDGEFVLLAEDGANSLIDYPITYTKGKIWVNNHAHVLSGKNGITNTNFLAYLLKKVNYEEILVGGTRLKLNGKILRNINIYLPPLPEQKAIADTLLTFDKHIENLEKLIKKKKMIREGTSEDLMSGKRRLDGFNGEWEEKEIFVLLEVLNGLTYSPEDVKKNGVLVLRSSNIKDDRLVFTDNVYVDERKIYSSKVKNGDIIMCVRNGSASLIGKTALVRDEINATIGAFMSNLRCHEFINNVFVYYFFKTTKFKDEIDKILGATINQITKSDLKKIIISYPTDIKEQEAIAAILTSMDDEIEDLEKEKAKIENLKAGAMDDLLTGRVRLI